MSEVTVKGTDKKNVAHQHGFHFWLALKGKIKTAAPEGQPLIDYNSTKVCLAQNHHTSANVDAFIEVFHILVVHAYAPAGNRATNCCALVCAVYTV